MICVCELVLCVCVCFRVSIGSAEYEAHMHLNNSDLINCIPAFRSDMFNSASEKTAEFRVN